MKSVLGPSQLDEALDRKCRETDFDRQNAPPVARTVCQKNCARKNVNTLTRELISIYNRPQSRDQTAEKGKEIISSFEQLPLVHLPSPGVSGRSVVGRTAAAPFTSAKAEDEDWTHFFLVINFLTSPTALVLFIWFRLLSCFIRTRPDAFVGHFFFVSETWRKGEHYFPVTHPDRCIIHDWRPFVMNDVQFRLLIACQVHSIWLFRTQKWKEHPNYRLC